jgi:Protein of unknown function (DUF1579)
MKRASMLALAAIVLSALFAFAQNPPGPPKPAPELQKLKYFLGTWKTEGDVKPGPMGPGGKFTGVDHNAWMPGGFFIVGHNNGSMGPMKVTGTSYLGYNAEEKVYTYNEFNSMGESVAAKGTVEGDTWTWTNEEKMQGKPVKGRFTEKITSPTSYDFKFEMSMDGKPFETVMEGKATKEAAAEKSEKAPAADQKAEKKPEKK